MTTTLAATITPEEDTESQSPAVDQLASLSHSADTMATRKKTASKKTAKTPKPAAPPKPIGRPSELSGPLGDLAEKLGGVEKLAEAVGVSARTIQRYHAEDVEAPLPTRRILALLAKQHGTKAPFAVKE